MGASGTQNIGRTPCQSVTMWRCLPPSLPVSFGLGHMQEPTSVGLGLSAPQSSARSPLDTGCLQSAGIGLKHHARLAYPNKGADKSNG